MTYLIWTLPALAVIGAIASGRVGTLAASVIGIALALIVALTTAPVDFKAAQAGIAMLRGAWIGWVVVPYILGGLLFWQMAMRPGNSVVTEEARIGSETGRRRLLFRACFLIGPFAESATGFGIGIIGTLLLIRRLGLSPIHLVCFSLISQTMILWGGMGSGAIIAAAYARTDPTTLAVHCSLFLVAFNLFWLPLYWRLAAQAGIAAEASEKRSEALWLAGSVALLIGATALIGPETAMLGAYGPIIALRYLIDERPDRRRLAEVFRKVLPFVLLIGWLVITRLAPPLHRLLEDSLRLSPFVGTPSWSPLFHAGTWLVVAAVLTGLLRGQAGALAKEAQAAWTTGRLAVLSVIAFSMMAEILSESRIASGLAEGLYHLFGRWALILTPQISAVFGALANSGNAANGLFMVSQVSLAQEAALNTAAVAALQHSAALSLNMVSPVRMSIVCGLAGTPGHEREAYRAMTPFALVVIGVLLPASVLIALRLV